MSHLCTRAARKPAAMDLSSGRQTQPAGAAVSRAAARSAAGRTPRVHLQQVLLHAGPHVPLRHGDRPRAGAVPRASAQDSCRSESGCASASLRFITETTGWSQSEAVGGEYCALLQEDLMYCMQESWAGDEEEALECSPRSSLRAGARTGPGSAGRCVCQTRSTRPCVRCPGRWRGASPAARRRVTRPATLRSRPRPRTRSCPRRVCQMVSAHSCTARAPPTRCRSLDKSASEERLGASEERLGASEERLGASEERLGASEERLGASEERLGASEEYLGASEERLSVRLRSVSERLRSVSVRLRSVSVRLRSISRSLCRCCRTVCTGPSGLKGAASFPF